jgi:hypothetical protein
MRNMTFRHLKEKSTKMTTVKEAGALVRCREK